MERPIKPEEFKTEVLIHYFSDKNVCFASIGAMHPEVNHSDIILDTGTYGVLACIKATFTVRTRLPDYDEKMREYNKQMNLYITWLKSELDWANATDRVLEDYLDWR